MTASLLTVKSNSLLPSQSIFNEIQSIHDTGFFHEIESMSKECGLNLVCLLCNATLELDRLASNSTLGSYI